MKASEIRELSISELETRISEVKKNLFNLKFQKASGQLDNPMKIKNFKRDIAIIETVAREQELGIKIAKPAKKSGKTREAKKVKAAVKETEENPKQESEKVKAAKVKKTAKKEKIQE